MIEGRKVEFKPNPAEGTMLISIAIGNGKLPAFDPAKLVKYFKTLGLRAQTRREVYRVLDSIDEGRIVLKIYFKVRDAWKEFFENDFLRALEKFFDELKKKNHAPQPA